MTPPPETDEHGIWTADPAERRAWIATWLAVAAAGGLVVAAAVNGLQVLTRNPDAREQSPAPAGTNPPAPPCPPGDTQSRPAGLSKD